MLAASLLLAAATAVPPQTARVLAEYEKRHAARLVPMLSEVLKFPTYAGNVQGHADQKAWLLKTSAALGFVSRDAGKITEIELPGPEGAPVLGLVIHGDVQAVDDGWSFPPFEGRVEKGYVLGRGAADDKGPLIQALLAMRALAASGVARTHTIRLLVGSEEESAAGEIPEYLKTHQPPDYSLVLDSEFPVVVGEKAWDGLAVAAYMAERKLTTPYDVESVDAGLGWSIVPDRASVTLRWREKGVVRGAWDGLVAELRARPLAEGTTLDLQRNGERLTITVHGKAAHAGVNLTGGRNALVSLAQLLEGVLPAGGANDLLAFAAMAGRDIYGTGLGIDDSHPIWGRYAVNVATLKPVEKQPGKLQLSTNLRRIPPRTGPQSRAHLVAEIAKFNCANGAALEFVADQSYFEDEPLSFEVDSPIVRRLMSIYERATGTKAPPAISGGGTYAKRLPNSIAFGMWFPGKPYPGHDRDEKISIDDLQRGTRVLIHALVDIATGPKIENAFRK